MFLGQSYRSGGVRNNVISWSRGNDNGRVEDVVGLSVPILEDAD